MSKNIQKFNIFTIILLAEGFDNFPKHTKMNKSLLDKKVLEFSGLDEKPKKLTPVMSQMKEILDLETELEKLKAEKREVDGASFMKSLSENFQLPNEKRLSPDDVDKKAKKFADDFNEKRITRITELQNLISETYNIFDETLNFWRDEGFLRRNDGGEFQLTTKGLELLKLKINQKGIKVPGTFGGVFSNLANPQNTIGATTVALLPAILQILVALATAPK